MKVHTVDRTIEIGRPEQCYLRSAATQGKHFCEITHRWCDSKKNGIPTMPYKTCPLRTENIVLTMKK